MTAPHPAAHRAHARSRRGVTLVEVLAAVVVLGVGLVYVMGAFSACARTTGLIRSETVAKLWAANMLAEARGNPDLLISGDSGDLGAAWPGFKWTRKLREGAERGTLVIEITVQWRTQGVARDYTLTSLVESPRY